MTSPTLTTKQHPDRCLEALTQLLLAHSDKRVVVVGTTCTGKSTLAARIPGARDMDTEVFPLLSEEEKAYVCRDPWTEEIGRTMIRLVRERIQSEAGRPVFGTVLLESDLVILLKISDGLLAERASLRAVNLSNAKNMQAQLEQEVRSSGIPWIEYHIG